VFLDDEAWVWRMLGFPDLFHLGCAQIVGLAVAALVESLTPVCFPLCPGRGILRGEIVALSGGRIVADGPTMDLLADEQLLAAHDLELPDGFDLRLISSR